MSDAQKLIEEILTNQSMYSGSNEVQLAKMLKVALETLTDLERRLLHKPQADVSAALTEIERIAKENQ